MATTDKTSNTSKKVTLFQIYKDQNLEVLQYIDKKVLTENNVVFCVLKADKVDVTNSKFDIKEQWQLTILTPITDGSVRKYWLTFTPNEVRDDYMLALQEGLKQAKLQNMECVHSCKLLAIPSQYDNPFYALDFTNEECACGYDN